MTGRTGVPTDVVVNSLAAVHRGAPIFHGSFHELGAGDGCARAARSEGVRLWCQRRGSGPGLDPLVRVAGSEIIPCRPVSMDNNYPVDGAIANVADVRGCADASRVGR